MDWLFTLSSIILFFAIGVLARQLFNKNRNLHQLYIAVIAILISAVGLWRAFYVRQVDFANSGAVLVLLTTFALVLTVSVFWSNITTNIDSRKLFMLRFCGFLGYIMLLMAIADWHEEMVPVIHTMLFGSTIVLLGFIPAFWVYAGNRLPLGIAILVWIVAGLLTNMDPILFKQYYLPMWFVLFSLAVVLGLLPKTIKSLWQR